MHRTMYLSSRLAALVALLFLAAVPAQPQSLISHGGRVLHHPRVHVLYWHNDWDSVHSDPQFKRANIDNWLRSFIGSNYFDVAGQYSSHSGSFEDSNQSSILCAFPPFGRTPGGSTDSLTIHGWLTCEIEIPGTGVPYPCDDDDVYVVLLPKGTQINNIFNQTCTSFGAYHLFAPILVPPVVCGLFDLGGIHLAPYVVIPVDCATKAAGPNGFFTDFDELTTLLSHEIVEAGTDPIDSFVTSVPVVGDIFGFLLGITGGGPGWYDSTLSLGDLFTKSEAADICEFPPFSPDVWLNNSLVAAYWSNADGACACGPGVVKSFTLRQTGVAGGIPVPVTFDTRTPDVNAGGGFTIQVATNTSHSYSYPTPVNGAPGARYVTSEPPATVNVTDDFSKTAVYTPQFFLTVSTNPAAAAAGNASLTPSDWYGAGPITIHTDPDVSAGSGTRYHFTSWGGDISAATSVFTFTLGAPTNAVANYVLQRLVTFDQTGIPAGPTWHVTVNGTEHVGPFADWFGDGSTVVFTYQSPVPDTTVGTRYVLTGTSPTSPLLANAPKTVTGVYKTQHLLTVNTSGLGLNTTHLFNSGALIGTASDGTPFSDWFDHGTALALSADDLVDGANGISYFFQGFMPTPPAALNAPFTTTAIYKTMEQLINEALASGGIFGPGANGIANSLKQKSAALTAKLAAGQYATALEVLKAFINETQAQTGKHITPALSTTLQLDALLVFHSALCKAKAAGQLNAARVAADYAYYSGLVTSLGGTPKPPC